MAMHNPIFIDDFSHLDLHLYMILPNKTSTYRWLKHIYIVKISATKTSIYSVFSCIFPCFPWFCLPFSHVLLWLCHRLCHPVPHRGTSQPDLAEHQRGWWVRPPERGHLRGKWNLYFFKDWCNERELSIYIYIPCWWYTYPFEKYEFVSWDDYSQYMENKNMFQTLWYKLT